MKHLRRLAFAAFVAAFITSVAATASADDPPSRVARLSFTSGEVSMQPGGVDDWAAAVLNRPFTTADRLWTDQSARAEFQLGGAAVRMESQTSLTFTNVADNLLQVELDQGTLDLHVARLMDGEIYEVDTPNAAFTVYKPGDYRFDVDAQGDATLATVWRGKLVATGQGPEVHIDSHHQAQFSSGQSMFHRMSRAPRYDDFDEWCRARDEREWRVVSARYVSPDVIGYEDLDGYGAWRELPQYGGGVWFPAVEAGWAPYHAGHWIWVEPWGWTWVDNASWGFAPFHYGRWVYFLGRWGWVPGPAHVRATYAPALVVWAGGNAGGVAWFPLSFGEPYVPYYHVSRNYFETVNVSNTRITNITYVTNTYYNNHDIHVTNIHYRNETVPGAVIMVRNETIINSRSVDRDRIIIHGGEWREHGVLAGPPVPPSTESVLGPHHGSPVARPIVEHPRVVVKQSPPPERLPFETRRDAIAGNAGRPLDRDEEQRLRASHPEHPARDWNNAPDDRHADRDDRHADNDAHHADNDARRDHGASAKHGNEPEHGDDARRNDNDARRNDNRGENRSDDRSANDAQRDHGFNANRGNEPEHGGNSRRGDNDVQRGDNEAQRNDNDGRRDHSANSNRDNNSDRRDDAHRQAPQDNSAAQPRNDRNDDRGMKDNGRHGFPPSNPSNNANAGQGSNSNPEPDASPKENRGSWQRPDRGGNPAQSQSVQANPVQTSEGPQHIVHRPPVAGSYQDSERGQGPSHDRSQDRGQDRNQASDQSHNNAAQQPPAQDRQQQQQDARPAWGATNPRQPQQPAQPAAQNPAQNQNQNNPPTESNSAPARIVPRPPFGRGPASEPASQPAQSQPSASPVMNSGHSAPPIAQPPMQQQQQNNAPAERNVPHPSESNHGFSAPQQQSAAAPSRPAEESHRMPPQESRVTLSAAPQSAPARIERTAAPQTPAPQPAAHGNNHAPAPQPQQHPAPDAHNDKSQKPSGPQH